MSPQPTIGMPKGQGDRPVRLGRQLRCESPFWQTSAATAMATGRARLVLGILPVPELVEVGDHRELAQLWCGVGLGVSHSNDRGVPRVVRVVDDAAGRGAPRQPPAG